MIGPINAAQKGPSPRTEQIGVSEFGTAFPELFFQTAQSLSPYSESYFVPRNNSSQFVQRSRHETSECSTIQFDFRLYQPITSKVWVFRKLVVQNNRRQSASDC